MPLPLSARRVRDLLHELRRLTAERARGEAETARAYEARTAAARRSYEEGRVRVESRRRAEQTAADEEYQQSRDHILQQAEEGLRAARNEFGQAREAALEQYQTDEEAANHEYQEARWTQDAVLEARGKKAKGQRDHTRRQLSERQQTVATVRQETLDQLKHWSLVPPGAGSPDDSGPLPDDPLPQIDQQIDTAREYLTRLRGLIAPRVLVGDRLLWGAFAAWVLVALTSFFLPVWYLGPILATVVAVLGGVGLRFGLAARSRAQSVRLGQPLCRALAEAERLIAHGEQAAEDHYRKDLAESREHYKAELRTAEKQHRKKLAEVLQVRDAAVQRAEAQFARLSAEYASHRDSELARIDAAYHRRCEALNRACDAELAAVTEQSERATAETERWYEEAFGALADAWHGGTERLRADLDDMRRENDRLFPDWPALAAPGWKPPTGAPAGIRFGELGVNVGTLPGGQPTHERLRPFEPQRFAVPALLPFPHRCATLLHTADAGRAAGVQALQALMLRFLTALPPGKVRFTIIDPVGLGENFAAFMHLADYDEQLVGSRIWTETHQIERRLTDLTAHMENVIQKYLRNQYSSIEEYNEQAGEVAEPYRVLVVANYPAGFSAEAARRLERIAASGASCGVYTLVSVDTKLPIPQGLTLADLEQVSLNLHWHAGRWDWEDADFGQYPLTVDAPPDAAAVTRIVRTVGAKALEASRVEVDFEFIAPPPERWWSGDSRSGLDVPLGRAGATKRQHLQLGKGTSQHALVAGKTGSGKSTLLHVLVTNLALNYSPDEIELYLIDFKKGVEFKTYATHELPHARVVAVESEREFGLSVLQRLDAELKHRGELFRTAGVQDIASYRDSKGAGERGSGGAGEKITTGALLPRSPAPPLPRILLVVDEFQEFFVEDDRIAQEAALLLDRLVRQGRAFGLHVLLGSQTLGGAYSLARSTIDQMAVRIALQCSEADANLILSKDNNAARLLSRPGEAIYNDANGLVEGNDVFQVVWLPDERREAYLEQVRALARERGWAAPAPPVVFEGNRPADIDGNDRLRALLDQGGASEPARERVVWLGDALAIKEPTAAVFRRQSGSNLLLVGQQAEAARAVLTAAAVALAAQHPPGEDGSNGLAPVTIFDGSPADDPHAGYFAHLAAALPNAVRRYHGRDLPAVLAELSEELGRRERDPAQAAPPLFVVVYGLHRLRDLRKAEDDFGFGRKEKEPGPAERFAELVREGAAAGIHLLVWCDSLANAQRALDRSGLREFEMRVLFQMGLSDSSTLIDSPLASRLGPHRALFASEELSTPEKFRPYRLPPGDWLVRAGAALSRPRAYSPA